MVHVTVPLVLVQTAVVVQEVNVAPVIDTEPDAHTPDSPPLQLNDALMVLSSLKQHPSIGPQHAAGDDELELELLDGELLDDELELLDDRSPPEDELELLDEPPEDELELSQKS